MRANGCGENAGDSPVLLKIAPDLSLTELDDVVHIARSRRVDGMIVANTTLARPSTLREQARAKEQGGLSGRPLFRLSTRMVAETYVRAEGAFPLVGVGGIDTGGAALTENPRRRQPDPALFVAGLQGSRPGRRHQERSGVDAAAHRARSAVGNRRRRCRHDHRRGLAGLEHVTSVIAVWSGPVCAHSQGMDDLTIAAMDGSHSQLHDHPVARRGVGERIQPPQHVVAHMGQHQPLRPDLGEMRLERLQAEMVFHDLVVVIGLGDEQVGIARQPGSASPSIRCRRCRR